MSLSKTSVFIIGTILVLGAIGLAVVASNQIAPSATTLSSGNLSRSLEGEKHTPMKLGEINLDVVVVDDSEKRTLGLSNVASLATNEAMLFVFDKPDMYGFWMKEMQFPLDILWLDSNGVVVYMKENLSPVTYPEIFTPDQPAQYVLEVNAGFVEQNNTQIGDALESIDLY